LEQDYHDQVAGGIAWKPPYDFFGRRQRARADPSNLSAFASSSMTAGGAITAPAASPPPIRRPTLRTPSADPRRPDRHRRILWRQGIGREFFAFGADSGDYGVHSCSISNPLQANSLLWLAGNCFRPGREFLRRGQGIHPSRREAPYDPPTRVPRGRSTSISGRAGGRTWLRP